MRKILISIILVISLVITAGGCSSDEPDTSLSTIPELSLNPLDDNVNIIIYRPPVGDFDRYTHLDAWHDLMLEKFNIDIEINYISPLHQSAIATADYYPTAILDGSINGIIELNVGDFVNLAVLRDAGLILPIDNYLKDNEIFQSLPGAMKSAFVLPDGKTWALPTDSMYGIYSRNLRKDWLVALDLSTPGTLEQLYEVSKAFAYDDPNGNGKADEHGMDINLRTSARMLLDIFLANDCYLSSYSACSLSYDYSTKSYEDAVLKPGMLDSLLYIKELHSDGILHMNMNWDFREREGFGNFYDLSGFYQTDDDWEKIYTFNHGEYPSICALKQDSCFIITSNCDDPKGTLNSFVNTFMGSTEGMAMGLLGLPDINFRAEGNKLTQITDFSHEETLMLTGLNINLVEQENLVIESDFFDRELLENMKFENALIEDMFAKNMLYTDSWFLPHENYKNAQRSFSHSFYTYLIDIDNVRPDEFISNYKKRAIEAGYDEILEDLNEDAGTKSHWSYGD